MPRDFRTATTFDLDEIKSEFDRIRTEAVIDIAFVTDSNHNNPSRNDLSVGSIKGKSQKFAGSSDLVDFTYKPIDANLSKYPIPGEFVLVVRTGVGNYYLNSINLSDNPNNNIDRRKKKGYVLYTDDEYLNQSQIKNERQLDTDSKIDSQVFKTSNLRKRVTNYGDVSLEGRKGNIINLSYSQNQQPSLLVSNAGSRIFLNDDVLEYRRVTELPFNEEIEPIYSQKGGDKILLESEKIILQSYGNGGMFLESVNSIGMVSDNDVTINSSRLMSLNAPVITIGDGAIQPVILGSEFSTQWRDLLNGLHDFLDLIINGVDNPTISTAATLFKETVNSKIAPKNEVLSKSASRFLSNQVFTK